MLQMFVTKCVVMCALHVESEITDTARNLLKSYRKYLEGILVEHSTMKSQKNNSENSARLEGDTNMALNISLNVLCHVDPLPSNSCVGGREYSGRCWWQLCGHIVSLATRQHEIMEEMFSVPSVPGPYNKEKWFSCD
jgi:hypothetical protein